MPLPKPNPMLVSELFALDPLKRTREQTQAVIDEYRKKRELWVQNGTRAAAPKAPKKTPVSGKVSLDDLDLGAPKGPLSLGDLEL